MSDTTTEPPDLDMPAIPPPDGSDVEFGAVADSGADDGDIIYRRSVSPSTRKLFASAAKSLGEQIASGAMDDDEPAIPPPNETPVAAAAPVASGATPPVAGAPVAAAAPALVDPAAGRKALELDVREKAIADREARIVERETRADSLANARDRYMEKPFETIRDLIKEWTGASTDDEMRDEISDLVTDLSANGLGLGVSEAVRTRSDAKRALKLAKNYKASAERTAAETAKKAEEQRVAADQKHRAEMAMNGIAVGLKTAGKDYPHLMLEDEPHAIVWDVIKTKAERDPTWVPSWTEAAQLANNHFKAQQDKQRQKLSRLPTPATQVPASGAKHQGAAQGQAARTLTNAVTAPTPAAAPVDDDEPYDRNAARNRSRAKLRAELEKRTAT
jgi:hypothetical protein